MFPMLASGMNDIYQEMGEIIEEANSNHLLYNVCIKFRDFITLVSIL